MIEATCSITRQLSLASTALLCRSHTMNTHQGIEHNDLGTNSIATIGGKMDTSIKKYREVTRVELMGVEPYYSKHPG